MLFKAAAVNSHLIQCELFGIQLDSNVSALMDTQLFIYTPCLSYASQILLQLSGASSTSVVHVSS